MMFLIVLLAAVSMSVAMPGYVPVHYGAYGVLPQPVQDTPEVSAAKAAHFAAHAKALSGISYSTPYVYAGHGHGGSATSYSNSILHSVHSTPYVVDAAPVSYGHGYHDYQAAHVVLTPHGVPVDTPEVQAARAANAAAHAAAKHQHLYG